LIDWKISQQHDESLKQVALNVNATVEWNEMSLDEVTTTTKTTTVLIKPTKERILGCW
jgi:hypothetical protein